MYNVLLTCPPMLKQFDSYKSYCEKFGLIIHCAKVTQTLSEEELIELIPKYDGWIIGDDPATRNVFIAGKAGKLKAAVKWGVGVDNVDFDACVDLNIPIQNIPGVFGEEVSDIGIGYMIGLTRHLFEIDRSVRENKWIKPCGNSLSGKKVCLIGFGDIGRCSARKLLAFNTNVYVSDPGFIQNSDGQLKCIYNPELKVDHKLHTIKLTDLNEASKNCDFIFITCALNTHTYHIVNENIILNTNKGVRIINVSRGKVINENDVIQHLETGHIGGVAFDVFETEPLPITNKLRTYNQNIFGTHNASNTIEAVDRTSYIAIDMMHNFLHEYTEYLHP